MGLLVPVTDNNTILDTRMTASSIHINIYYYQPYYGRLHETREFGGWCPHNKSDRSEYLQVDMGEVRSVSLVLIFFVLFCVVLSQIIMMT